MPSPAVRTPRRAPTRFCSGCRSSEKRKASSSLKFCLIARGEADLYARLGQTSEWDTAAGQAILAAAGGSVTTLDGQPLIYGKREAGYANPHFIAWAREPLLRAPETPRVPQ